MHINYFGNSSILGVYQKNSKKAMIAGIYWIVSEMGKNLKRVSREILEDHG